MKVLLDQNLSEHLVPLLEGHEVFFARQLAWDRLVNGMLLESAERAGFDVMVTADQKMAYQQNHLTRRVAFSDPEHESPVRSEGQDRLDSRGLGERASWWL